MTPDDSADELTPAEQALNDHLQLLRSSPPETDRTLIVGVVHSVRWQRAVRRPVIAAAALAAAAVDGIRLLFGGRSRR